MGGSVRMPGEGHLLCHRDSGIVGNQAKSQLSPAVVLVKVGVFDPSFFVEFPAELERTAEGSLDNKKIIGKILQLCAYFAN
jgi:hypothetical protein